MCVAMETCSIRARSKSEVTRSHKSDNKSEEVSKCQTKRKNNIGQ